MDEAKRWRKEIFKETEEDAENETILSFITEICRTEKDDSIMSLLYLEIHNDKNVKKLIEFLDMKFKYSKLADLFQLIYKLELDVHDGNVYAAELCLKKSLGTNELSAKFMSYVEYSFLCRQNLKFLENFELTTRKMNPNVKFALTDTSSFIINVMMYYLDLVKDVFFILIRF